MTCIENVLEAIFGFQFFVSFIEYQCETYLLKRSKELYFHYVTQYSNQSWSGDFNVKANKICVYKNIDSQSKMSIKTFTLGKIGI